MITWEKLQTTYAEAIEDEESCEIYNEWMEAYPNRRVWWRKMEQDLDTPEAYAQALQDAMVDSMSVTELDKIKSQIQYGGLLRHYDALECVEDEISIEDNQISIVYKRHVYDFSLGDMRPDKEWICLSPDLTKQIMTQKVKDFLNAMIS